MLDDDGLTSLPRGLGRTLVVGPLVAPTSARARSRWRGCRVHHVLLAELRDKLQEKEKGEERAHRMNAQGTQSQEAPVRGQEQTCHTATCFSGSQSLLES